MMAKIILQTFEVSDLKKVVYQTVKKVLEDFPKIQEKENLKLLSRKDASKLLCVSLPTLHQWTKDGVVTAYRIGTRVLYKLEDINKALTQIKTLKFNKI
jgi:excisionase family DNA binding protein